MAFQNLIGGDLRPASSGMVIDSIDPATGEAWAQFPRGGPADAVAALAAARDAFPEWSRLAPDARARYLVAAADALTPHLETLAELEARDTGRLLSETSRRDVPLAIELWRAAAHEGEALAEGEVAYLGETGVAVNRREPHGVVLAITPWNAPLLSASQKAALALAAGNTVILKPAELAAASVLRLGEILSGVLPPGVLNIVCGTGDEVGTPLVQSRDVNMITFTGSIETAKKITSASSGAPKPMTLLLGGKSANIVFAEADLDKAAKSAAREGIFTSNAGQICYAGSRILIQRSIYDDFMKRLADEAQLIRLGSPSAPDTSMGPLISRSHHDWVTSFLESGQAEGVELIFGGGHGPGLVEESLAGGFWVEPTLFATDNPGARVCQEEIFGPVAVAMPFESEGDAIRLANESRYGLAAAVWTSDLGVAQRMIRGLNAGMVWVNAYRTGVFPFEGRGDSGYGSDSLAAFTRAKAALIAAG